VGAGVDQVIPGGLLGHDLALEQAQNHRQALHHPVALGHRIDAQHHRVRRQQARPDPEHHPPAGHVVELDDPVRGHEGVVVGQRNDAGAELDPLGALGGGGDEQLRAGDDLEARRVVFADPGLFVTEPVQHLDKLEVALNRLGRIAVERMERRHEDAVAHRKVRLVGVGLHANSSISGASAGAARTAL
jgi:hypothetical protein